MTKFLTKTYVKLGGTIGCGLASGCVAYYGITVPILEQGLKAIPTALFSIYILSMGVRIAYKLFE